MALVNSYDSVGNREDLSNVVTRIAVEKTPLYSTIGSSKATSTKHEWLTESLAAPAFNAEIEGAVAAYGAGNTRVRNQNYTQIFRKTGQVTDTQQAVLGAGVKDEYGHQLKISTVEIARDVERALWQGAESTGGSTAGAPDVARTSRGVLSFCSTNLTSNGTTSLSGTAVAMTPAATTMTLAAAGAVAAGDHILINTGTGSGQYRIIASIAGAVITVTEAWDVIPLGADSTYTVYLTPKAATSDIVNDGLQAAYEQGGEPNAIYVSGSQKRAVSGFATSTRVVNDGRKEFTSTIDMLDTDFGRIAVKYDRWVPSGVIACLEESKFRVANLRPIVAEEMPRTGSARNYMIEGELCLESLGENASAIVAGNAV